MELFLNIGMLLVGVLGLLIGADIYDPGKKNRTPEQQKIMDKYKWLYIIGGLFIFIISLSKIFAVSK